MITIILQGGLGNQLFQICTVMAYFFKYKIPFKLPTIKEGGDYNSPHGKNHKRPLYFNNFFKSLTPFLENIPVYGVYREKQTFKYAVIPSFKRNVKLAGYFQSYKYFHDYYDNIIKFLKINEQKQVLINKFQNIDFENSISLHFRIGDYKVVQHHHPILSIDYYKKALTIIKEKNKLDGVNVIYFFEKKDIDEVNNKVKQLKNYFPEVNFISLNDLQDWEEMLTMSLCKHNIIANSTFSWWGAYFNENKEKIVCYPNKWINSNVTKQDLFFDSWTEIKA